MRLYRYQGTEVVSPVAAWITETAEYKNMMSAAGRWFTDSFDEAVWYACDHDGGVVVYLDLDDHVAERWRVANLPLKPGGRETHDNPAAWSLRPSSEFFLPSELAFLARPLGRDQETEEAALRM